MNAMSIIHDYHSAITRRHFFGRSATGIGTAALAWLLNEDVAAGQQPATASQVGLPGLPHFAPRAKRVIYLFQSGAPSQMDLFDYKPTLRNLRGTDLPASIRRGQRRSFNWSVTWTCPSSSIRRNSPSVMKKWRFSVCRRCWAVPSIPRSP